jgi:chaperonin GroEL (HSP60 family)
MQTAMQKMIEYLHENKYFDAIPVAKELLEKEKEQIKDAYGDGLNAHRTNFCNRDEYYNQTYNQNK